jgi:effector-binding domain-containing protein
MQYDVRIEENVDGRPLAVVRRRARLHELSKVVPEACGLVWKTLRTAQVRGAGRHVAIYLDGEINLEVGVEMNAPFGGHGEVIASSLPVGLVASTVHFGPYPKLYEAHKAICDYAARHGYGLAGSNWEIYGHWVDDWNQDSSKIRTDVFYLLKPAAASTR